MATNKENMREGTLSYAGIPCKNKQKDSVWEDQTSKSCEIVQSRKSKFMLYCQNGREMECVFIERLAS